MKLDRRTWKTGAAIPETAMTIGVCLMLLFGAFEVATVGYYQVMVDGAAYIAAHESALGVGNTAGIVAQVFSQINPGDVTTTVAAVDNTYLPTNYNLTDSAHRHGGVALVRPQHLQVQVAKTNVGGLLTFDGQPTRPISVSGAFIEPQNMTVDPGFNLAGSDPNNVMPGDTAKYFSDDANVPPFMIGFHMFRHCGSNDLQCQAVNFASAGIGEFLDSDNWNAPANGVNTGATFAAMACHQRYFARLANELPLPADVASHVLAPMYPTPPAVSAWQSTYDESLPQNVDLSTVYSWDVPVNGGDQLDRNTVGAFPLHPLNGC